MSPGGSSPTPPQCPGPDQPPGASDAPGTCPPCTPYPVRAGAPRGRPIDVPQLPADAHETGARRTSRAAAPAGGDKSRAVLTPAAAQPMGARRAGHLPRGPGPASPRRAALPAPGAVPGGGRAPARSPAPGLQGAGLCLLGPRDTQGRASVGRGAGSGCFRTPLYHLHLGATGGGFLVWPLHKSECSNLCPRSLPLVGTGYRMPGSAAGKGLEGTRATYVWQVQPELD